MYEEIFTKKVSCSRRELYNQLDTGETHRSSPTSLSLQMPKIDRWPQEELGEEHTYGKIIRGNPVH